VKFWCMHMFIPGWPDWANFRPNSPNVWLLTLGSGLKMTKVANIYGVLFPMVPVMY
jgi:hypothetical protein